MSENASLSKVENFLVGRLKEMFKVEFSGHDLMHLVRTKNLAKHLAQKEGGDLETVVIAALTHDIHRSMQQKGQPFIEPKNSLSMIESLLKEVEVEPHTVKKILHCVEFHEEYGFSAAGKTALDLETQILQDADNLDAIGAIGIARCFSYGGSHGIPIYDPDIALDKESSFDESVSNPSEIHHFYAKLLKLKENMNTQSGRKMAEARHAFMEEYLDHFFREWEGKI